jgi:hypothetical protein
MAAYNVFRHKIENYVIFFLCTLFNLMENKINKKSFAKDKK